MKPSLRCDIDIDKCGDYHSIKWYKDGHRIAVYSHMYKYRYHENVFQILLSFIYLWVSYLTSMHGDLLEESLITNVSLLIAFFQHSNRSNIGRYARNWSHSSGSRNWKNSSTFISVLILNMNE